MTAELIPANEAERMAAVRRYDILDTPPDGAFERITALAARLFEVPISIVSIVDTDRIWFKSHHGLDVEQIDRDPGLCASAILQREPWLVTDASADPRALSNPLVAGEHGLRFYAGVPLETSDGYNLGTLCVIDNAPREVSVAEMATLTDLASLVIDELELRRSARRTHNLEADLRLQAEDIARTLQETLLPPKIPDVPGLTITARYHVANRDQVGGDFYDVIPTDGAVGIVVGDSCGKGAKAAALTGTARWTLRTVTLDAWGPADALDRLNRVLVGANDHPRRYATLAMALLRPRLDGGTEVTLALAGHPHPLIVRSTGAVEPLGTTSPVVGWSLDACFTEVSAVLDSGDCLVLFTDGVLDAVAGRGSVDDAPLRDLLAPLAGRGASDIAEAVDRRLDDLSLEDDAAFVVIESA